MSRILIKNGYVVDPSQGFEGLSDLYIENGRIGERAPKIEREADIVYDARGLTILPGLVDLHVHLRDPGLEYKESIETGSAAAARGGVTSLVAMANTKPVADCREIIEYVTKKAEETSPVHIYQAGAQTKDMAGEELTDMADMVSAGVRAFSEDGRSVMTAALQAASMAEAARLGVPILSHCEDKSLVRGGVMNADDNAERLGLPGITNAVEDVITIRDILLAKETGCHLHLCHCSTEGSTDLIRLGRKMGVSLSAEVCPHHFILTSDDIPEDDGNYKMNPPLRTRRDVEALKAALADGTIDCISTDHAPHAVEEKNKGFLKSAFGIVGIETSAALTYTYLVRPGILTLMQMAEKMSLNPAKVLGIEGGSLQAGAPADLAVFDFEQEYVIDPEEFMSKGTNTPFAGWKVYGRTRLTVCGGDIVWEDMT